MTDDDQKPTLFNRIKQKARQIKAEIGVLALAYRHPETPWYAKAFAGLVVAYAFSPIDLVPDFIPVLGYLDDIILIPLGISLALKMIPAEVMEDCREKAAQEAKEGKPKNWFAGAFIILLWVLIAALCVRYLYGLFV